jgi:serine/threonine protein kinase
VLTIRSKATIDNESMLTAELIGFGLSALRDESAAATDHEGSIYVSCMLICAQHVEYSQTQYMSPEQTGLLRVPIDHRSDLYSLGVTFYQLLAGRLPFEGSNASIVADWHVHAKETPLLDLTNTRLPVCAALSAIVGKLMAKQAADRYQSAFGVAADLNKCLMGNQHTAVRLE